MKKIKLIIGIVSAALVVGMFVMSFFADAVNDTLKMSGLVYGAKEIIQNDDPIAISDLFGIETTGLNILPFIGGLVAVICAVAFVVINFVVKCDKLKAILGAVFAILIVAGSVMQFYSLAMLPDSIVNEMIREAGAEVSPEERKEVVEYIRQMINSLGLKLGPIGIISGVLGSVGGAGIVASSMLPSEK